jgi:hypothetical protein
MEPALRVRRTRCRAKDIPFLSLAAVARDPDEGEEEIDEETQYEVSLGLQS